jgi:hypothetical protein
LEEIGYSLSFTIGKGWLVGVAFRTACTVETRSEESSRILRHANDIPLQHDERALPISIALSQRTNSTADVSFKLGPELESSSRAALCGAIDRIGVCNPYAEDRCWANGCELCWSCGMRQQLVLVTMAALTLHSKFRAQNKEGPTWKASCCFGKASPVRVHSTSTSQYELPHLEYLDRRRYYSPNQWNWLQFCNTGSRPENTNLKAMVLLPRHGPERDFPRLSHAWA